MNYSLRYIFDKKNVTGHKKKEADKIYAEIGLVQIEVRLNGTNKAKLISTGIKIKPSQFSTKNGFTCIKHPHASQITGQAKGIFDKIYKFVHSDACRNFDDLQYWNKETTSSNFYIIPFITGLLKNKDIAYGTLKSYNTLINRLKEFNKLLSFRDATYHNIVLFDKYLKSQDNQNSTLHKRHTALRSFLAEAVKQELLQKNPYDLFDIPPVNKIDPTYLEEHEIKQLQNYKPAFSYIENVRNLFLFQCYTGMAYVDLVKFTKENISVINGREVIKDTRQKTDVNFIIPILPEAKRILELYNYQLPIISNQKYNRYLKDLAQYAEITKTLTTHVARHTFATYLINKNIPIETVSKVLGHSNIKQTQHYARLLGKKIIDDFDVLFDD